MTTWGRGYVTDIEYSDGFYPQQAPGQLALVATLNGFEAPRLDRPFTYCELGCGRGTTSLVLAATHPDAEFHAVDFHPAHIAHARQRAQAASLDNVRFHELSFDALTGPQGAGLPPFDVVTLHGVWSWIAPDQQRAITAFLDARLKPGGLLYVSYNALPAWHEVAPLQRVLKELAGIGAERSDLAVARAIEQLQRLAEAKIIPPAFAGSIARFTKRQDGRLPYLAHEYLNEHWRPVYFADVARELGQAKLSFVGCSDLLRNFHNLQLNDTQRALLAEMPTAELRETLKDFCTDHWFRQDVFVRGARRISAHRRERVLRAGTLALIKPAPEVFEVGKPDGSRWRPDPGIYHAIGQALGAGPRSVGELLELPELPLRHAVSAVELVGVLAGTGLAAPFEAPSAACLAGAAALNATRDTDEEARWMTENTTLAVGGLKSGVSLSPALRGLYESLYRGAAPDARALAAEFVARCLAEGGHPIIEGKHIEDPQEAREFAMRDYEIKIEGLVPIWRKLGMIG